MCIYKSWCTTLNSISDPARKNEQHKDHSYRFCTTWPIFQYCEQETVYNFPLLCPSMFQPFFRRKVILFKWRLVSIFAAKVMLWTAVARGPPWKCRASTSAKRWQLWQRIQVILLLSVLEMCIRDSIYSGPQV